MGGMSGWRDINTLQQLC